MFISLYVHLLVHALQSFDVIASDAFNQVLNVCPRQ